MQPITAIELVKPGLLCWKNIVKPVCHNSVRNSCVPQFPRGLAGRIMPSCGCTPGFKYDQFSVSCLHYS